ncbi:PREDICTED: histone-lysine N-methyltransferase SMYD3 [Nanorana parkeri]|uniref:histone-lysine N-methyltransferase SMYD3 n=1 Tax=Nanorana parkeri TaxID=125878 RepID=UPI0008544A87|nr:PREDICTED: histone-lysine N-methyltransferase SMYD3 [Nanorana parkeri]
MTGNFERFQSPGKGNGLQAARDLELGETVTNAEPFVHTVWQEKNQGATCHHCLHRNEKLKRCSQCKFAKYCNSRCQKHAWKDHKRECLCLKSIFPNVPTDSVRLVGKMIFKLLEHPDCGSGELYSIHDLQSHFKELNEEMKEGLRHLAATLEQYLKSEIQVSTQLPHGFHILEYFGKVTCNSFTISDGEMQDVGVGLYPSMSLLNHSCDPNCVIVFEGTCLQLRAVKKIPKGEELTISYIDVKMPTHLRQVQLQRQYCFSCDCHRCLSKDKDEDMLGGDSESSKKMEHSIRPLEQLCSQSKREEVLNLSMKLLNNSGLPDKNIQQLKLLDLAMDSCISLGMWEEALKFGLRTLNPYGLYYSNYHPVRAVQMMRVGKLQLHQGMFSLAKETLKQAFEIMKVTHGKGHSLTRDLTKLLHDCEMGLR